MTSLGDAVVAGLSSRAALQHLFTVEAALARLSCAEEPEPWILSPSSVRVSSDGPARLDTMEMLAHRWPGLFGRQSSRSETLYAAPECISGGAAASRALIYSAAMTTCFCLYGAELPPSLLEGKLGPDQHRQAMLDLVQRLGVKNGLKACLLRATAFDPATRPDTIGRFFEELRAATERGERPEPVEMVPIPGGEIWFGAPGQGARSASTALTPRHVEISDYCISRHPITQSTYQHILGTNPSRQPLDPDAPVNRVSFRQAAMFCNLLSSCEGLRPAYRIGASVELDPTSDGYRLPTEAEWELAARGADRRRYPWGDDRPGLQACWNGARNFFGEGNRRGPSAIGWHPEGASPFGVMDMAGNVWEWCHDFYQPDPPPGPSARNPMGPAESVPPLDYPPGPYRVVRGGAWNIVNEIWLETTARAAEREEAEHDDIGFRVVRGRLS